MILWLVLLAAGVTAGLRIARAGFALLGPTGNGGDNWQVRALGYPEPGAIGSAKNYGEGYRRNTPVLYYTCDANFLTYFGSNGLAAVDSAFAIMNNLSNVDAYSSDLSEFPLYSQHANYLAQTLELYDLKSVTLGIIFEEMGLADPVKYTWTLRDREHVGNVACPVGEEYLVVQRTFDSNPNQASVYTPYVNDVLYSYTIDEGCAAGAITAPFSVDPFALINTPVASFPGNFIDAGYFYSGLTRDDVAGLKYLYTSNNIVSETAAAGSDQLLTNSVPPVLQTTEPFSTLIAAAQTTDPAVLQTMFPGLEIATTTNFFVDQVTTNLSIYYTNTPGATITNFQPFQLLTTMDLGLFSELSVTDSPAQMEALYPGLVVVSSTNFVTFPVTTNVSYYYTNNPGPSITNFQPIQLLTTMDLGLFTGQASTNSPAQMLGLYPGLIIVSSNAYYTNIPTPNLVTYYKEPNGAPVGTLPVAVTVTNGFTPNFLLYYTYVFGNIYTNSYSSNSYDTIQTLTVKVPNGSPVGTPGVTNITTTKILVHSPGGEFFIMPTNWCGFKIIQTYGPYGTISTSNTVALSNFVSGVSVFTGTQTTSTLFTNHTYVIEPGTCEPALIYVTNYATNILVQYQTTFANLVTNSYSSNTVETLTTTNIGPCTNGLVGVLCTNITTQQVTLTNVPSGDFFILPTNWCGYDILYSNVLTTPPTPLMSIPRTRSPP